MLKGRVSGQNGVVGLDDGAGKLRCGVHAELELRLFPVIGRETLEEESTETGASSTTEGVEDKEALKTITVVRESAELVHGGVNELFTDGVVATRVLIRQDHALVC